MIEKILRFSIYNRMLVILLTLMAAGYGIYALKNLPIDAVPDITNQQVQINTIAQGLSAQFIIMPALGFFIGWVLDLPVTLKVGLVLAGSVPGAMASNVIVYLAEADVAYSIALTSSASLISPAVTPLLTFFYARTVIAIPFWGMFFSIIKIVILPLMAGFFLRKYFLSPHKWEYFLYSVYVDLPVFYS